jgi:hypothetical protein
MKECNRGWRIRRLKVTGDLSTTAVAETLGKIQDVRQGSKSICLNNDTEHSQNIAPFIPSISGLPVDLAWLNNYLLFCKAKLNGWKSPNFRAARHICTSMPVPLYLLISMHYLYIRFIITVVIE